MHRTYLAALLATILLAAAGCSHHIVGAGTQPGARDLGTTTTTQLRTCGSYTAGQDAVGATFCNGSGVAHVRINGRMYTVSGGRCTIQDNTFSFAAGVAIEGTFVGAKPSYVGVVIPDVDGAYSDGTVSVTLRDTVYVVGANHGRFDKASRAGTFDGVDAVTGTELDGVFTC